MKRDEILDAAKKCVSGDRDEQYGGPEDSFSVIAGLWEKYLRETTKGQDDVALDASDVAAMMILFKLARVITGANKDDNWIDIAGYAACGGEVSGA